MRRIWLLRCSATWKVALGCIAAVAAFLPVCFAQTSQFGRASAPVIGGTPGMPAPPKNPFQGITGNSIAPHQTTSGRPCIGVLGFARPQTTNPNVMNHQVLVANACGQTIKVKVCYYQETGCITVDVRGYEKVERTLGISAGIKDFRYESRELF